MTYEEAITYIESTGKYGSKLGLDSIKTLLEYLDNPQKHNKYIHVAGTNGKGSTSSFINNILIKAGYNIGFYTSPYLENINEVMRINSKTISNDDLVEVVEEVIKAIENMTNDGYDHPTQYEIMTAMAFLYFKNKKTDIVILEVGMGGRLDATNIIEETLVSIITPIAMDHIGFLGDTIVKIASEKAGIIKPGSDVVIAKQQSEVLDVIVERCDEKDARLHMVDYIGLEVLSMSCKGTVFKTRVKEEEYDELEIGMIGIHQVENALVALTALEVVKEKGYDIHDISLKLGLKETSWPGRLELLCESPRVVIDGAHNLHGAKALARTIKNIFHYDRLIAVIGVLGDKDIDGIFEELLPLCEKVIFTKPNNPRACDPESLRVYGDKYEVEYSVEPDIIKAYELAKEEAGNDDLILCCGSLYMIGKVREHII